MTLADISADFARCKNWEERYRLLIQYSRRLPQPDETELAKWPQIEGCESRLWFAFQAEPRSIHTYSEARLMQGVLFILAADLREKPLTALQNWSCSTLLESLQLSRHLTATKLNGLAQIELRVQQHLHEISTAN